MKGLGSSFGKIGRRLVNATVFTAALTMVEPALADAPGAPARTGRVTAVLRDGGADAGKTRDAGACDAGITDAAIEAGTDLVRADVGRALTLPSEDPDDDYENLELE